MIRQAQIDVHLTRSNGAMRATIASNRTPLPPALLHGKSPAAAADLLPRLFAICALAQGSAAAAACEAAMAAVPVAARQARRDYLASAEAVREHLLRLILGAAETLGEQPAPQDLDRLRSLTAALRKGAGCLAPADWRTASRDIGYSLDTLIAAHFHDAAKLGGGAFLAWVEAGVSPFARLCRQIVAQDQATLGFAPAGAVSDTLDLTVIGTRLLGPEGAAFAARPSLDSSAQETTAFARRRDEPLLKDLSVKLGDGLLTRLVARALDAVRLAESLPALAEAATETDAAFVLAPGGQTDGDGLAAVETARGRLIHAVRLRDGQIAEYRILAPTEWNFHPSGPVARRLVLLDVGATPPEIDRQARLLIDIFDPCIPYRLSVQ